MDTTKKDFWRGFTWKKFLLLSIYWFAATLVVAAAFGYFDPKATMSHNFAFISLMKRLAGSLIAGFFFTVWTDPK